MSIIQLASKYNWPVVLSFHVAILDSIEAGLANWDDDFCEISITESQRLPNATPSANNALVPGPYCKLPDHTIVLLDCRLLHIIPTPNEHVKS